ncbi:MAG: hypothetical protein WBR18_14495 [Anaerolineales bacterium]
MKSLGYVISTLLILTGIVWFLQGIGVLPGSFMSGQIQWAVAGAVSAAIGVGALLWLRQRPDHSGSE